MTRPQKRKRGAGGICECPDGRLVARIVVDGKRHVKYVTSRQEGRIWLARMQGGQAFEEHETVLRPSETAVLSYIARGYSNEEVAEALEISLQTVKNHVAAICAKLPARNRVEAAVWFVTTAQTQLEVIK